MQTVRPVGKIQAGDVHADAQQVTHDRFGVAGGADGADDLGAAGRGDTVLQNFSSVGLLKRWTEFLSIAVET
jgi:hypothetical protein